MIRAPIGDRKYWDKWIDVQQQGIEKKRALLQKPAENPDYEPQFVFNLARQLTELLIQRYSRGDDVASLSAILPEIVDAWEKSNRLSSAVCAAKGIESCRDWVFSLDNLKHYNWCLWLASFALTLDIPDEQWHRLNALIGSEGKDAVLDRIMSTKQPDRRIGSVVCHPKPYRRLHEAMLAPKETQARILQDFVERWYPELARKGEERLWWYDWCDPEKTPLEMGNYFGCWCFEAAATAKFFDIDDHLCLGHPHYPGDLVAPNRPSAHPVASAAAPSLVEKASGLLRRFIKR